MGLQISKSIDKEIAEKIKETERQATISEQLAIESKKDIKRIEITYKKSLRKMWIIIFSMAAVNLYGYVYS